MNKWGIVIGIAAVMIISLYNLPKIAFKNKNTFDDIFKKYGEQYNIPWLVLKGIASTESGLNPEAKNPNSSALGLMQITKSAAAQVGENWNNQTDPDTAIRTGAKYLRWIVDTYKFNLNDAIRAYYAGGGSISKEKSGTQITAQWQQEAVSYSKTYLSKVMGYTMAYTLQA